jgi:hypothetical protein
MMPADSNKYRYNLLATILSGIIIGSALIILTYKIGPERDVYPITYLICIFGYILGWIVAIISTPMNTTDQSDISKFSKLVGTFLSGYLLSKFDKLFEAVFDTNTLFTTINGPRLLLFGSCFGLTFILVFYYRRYKWQFPDKLS